MAEPAVEAEVMGVPTETGWMLPSGFGSLDVPPDEPFLHETIGRIDTAIYSPRPGLHLYVFDAAVAAPFVCTHQVLTGEPYLWLALNTRGRCTYRHGATMDGGIQPGMSYCAFLRDPLTLIDYPLGHHNVSGITVTPARLRDMLQGERIWGPIDDFLGGVFDPRVRAAPSSAAQLRIAGEIDRHPYRGAMANLFLEAKAYELFAETLRVLTDQDAGSDSHRIRRIAHAARDVMLADPVHPPLIADVARQLGVSQRRLNEIFREVFHASPLQCLVGWRLDLARQMLAGGEFSVKQVAFRFGYAHVSNFSLAFTRRFGHPPTGRPEPFAHDEDETP